MNRFALRRAEVAVSGTAITGFGLCLRWLYGVFVSVVAARKDQADSHHEAQGGAFHVFLYGNGQVLSLILHSWRDVHIDMNQAIDRYRAIAAYRREWSCLPPTLRSSFP